MAQKTTKNDFEGSKRFRVHVSFTEGLLGTASSDPELHDTYIASKAPDAPSRAEEIAAIGVEEALDKGKTVFPRDEDGNPVVYDYQWKGYFKDACGMLWRVSSSKSKKLKAYLKEIDGTIFTFPRMIRLELPHGGQVEELQRPLRARTAQGERVAIAHSEMCPAGTTCTFEVLLLDGKLESVLREWLDYGALRGLGQWRNSGMGRFEYTMEEI